MPPILNKDNIMLSNKWAFGLLCLIMKPIFLLLHTKIGAKENLFDLKEFLREIAYRSQCLSQNIPEVMTHFMKICKIKFGWGYQKLTICHMY